MINFGNDWDEILAPEFKKEYYLKLEEFVRDERSKYNVYPPEDCVFNALKYSSFEDTKVVIIGQDPYHQPGQAHGLCFSVNPGVKVPPSLVNIYKEQEIEFGFRQPDTGYLESWAKQGVLMLNATLTVRDSEPMSHKGKGWEIFTDRIIELLNERKKPLVFILWGANAKAKESLITNPDHLILTGTHPSPLSAHHGFFRGNYFISANRYLESLGQTPIDWQLKA